MIAPTKPADEAERLADLHRLRVLDTPPEERFDRITRLASALFDAPIALVSLVDGERQWFKSRQGMDVVETTRDTSFCGHAVLEDAVFEVPDAAADPRFHDNPLVVNGPRMRWYAGRPIHGVGGARVGTFCVGDRRPRRLGPDQKRLLTDLAALVETELHLVRLTELQQALADARARAEDASRSKSAFLAFVSHEIRNPITSLAAAADLLERTRLDPMQARYVAMHRRGADALLELVDNLLDLGRVESGQLTADVRPFDLRELVTTLVATNEARALANGIALRTVVDPALERHRHGDAQRVRHIVGNLLGNALKFTRKGSVTLTLEPADEGWVRFSVRDTGPGIPAERLTAVFEGYSQADPSGRRQFGGSGLGLAIAKGLTESLGGVMEAASVVGQGSTFGCRLPLPTAPPG